MTEQNSNKSHRQLKSQMINYSNSGKDFEIPVDIMEKWQRMVNIMSKLLHVPTGFIMKVNAPNIQIFTANVADTNPYHAGQNFELAGLYCEEVMKSDDLLCVPDALKDPEWDNNPEIPAGFVYYLGYPIHWPTGKMFGTICVQDYKNNSYATDNKDLLKEFRSVCEHDLLMVQMRVNLESIVAERTVDLRMSEERFRMTFEQAAVGIAHVAPDGKFIRINQKFCNIVGYSNEEMTARRFQDIMHLEDLSIDLEYYDQMLARKIETYSMEKRYIHKNKTTVWVNLTISLVWKDIGDPDYFIAVIEDISKRKKVEEALKKETEFQKLISKISTLFINIPVVDIDQAINKQFKEIGEFFNADRVTIGQLSEKGEVLAATNMWFSDKVNAEKLATDMMGATYPNLVNHLKDQKYWSFSNPDDFSHWHPERETIEKMDFKSGLVINTSFEKSILEIFVIDIMHSNRVWTKNIIEQVKLLGNIFSNALNRKHAEQALLKEAKFKQLVSQLSSKFTALSGVEFEHAIENSLAEVGSFFGVDTVRLYQLSPQGEVLKFRLKWQSDQLAPQNEMTEIHNMTYPNLAAHYSSGKSIEFNKFVDSPKWPEVRNILKFFGTKAGVGVPLESDNSCVDVFAMDTVISDYQWPDGIIEQAKVVGKVLLSAILRREAEVIIQNGYSEIRQLKDQLKQENIYLKEEIKVTKNFDTIIGQSSALKYVLHRLEQVAPTNANVLIGGATGTGKELFANALHKISLRKDKPLIIVGCASLSPTLIESELFGHDKGAFTGADNTRIGRFELANGATIFLDEIGDLPLELQPKLLRIIQEGEFERLGSSKTRKVDVRIIVATNRNLEEEVEQGRFRRDLYYRLSSFIITIPPLKERTDDIPLLVNFLVDKFAKRHNKNIKTIPKSVMRKLTNYSWPGNVRELENVIENALIISDKGILIVELPSISKSSSMHRTKLQDIEKDHIISVLESTNWKLGGTGGAAEILGLKRTTLYAKMEKLGIEKLK